VSLAAQQPPAQRSFDPEGRIDVIIARHTDVQGGIGFVVPLGYYVRSGLTTAAGANNDGASARVDLLTRFHLDPFREHKWGPYAGGGISARFEKRSEWKPYLLAFFGLDGPVSGGVVPAIELGLGGGARIGGILRRAAPNRR
jgi:hypothetical protein